MFLEMPTKKFIIFYANLTFITIFTKPRLLLSYFELISQYYKPSVRSILILFFNLCLGLQNDVFCSNYLTELCAFIIAPMRAT
jgi:hypothetical protein